MTDPIDASQFASFARFVNGDETMLLPDETATYTVAQGASFTTQFDGAAQSFYALQEGLELGISILTKFGLSDGMAANASLNELLSGTQCAASMASHDIAEVIVHCLGDPEVLARAIGPSGVFLSAMMTVTPVVEFFRSELDALGDQFNARDRYSLVVRRIGSTGVGPTPRQPGVASPATANSSTTLQAVHEWSWQSSDENGYAASFKFAAGHPARLSAAQLLPGFTASGEIASACSDFNPTTDALVPVQLTITNTTASFSYTPAAFFSLQESFSPSTVGDAEVVDAYSSGVQCETAQQINAGNDEGKWTVDCALKPGASCTNSGYIILQNYYTPNTPNGVPGALDAINFDISDTSTSSDAQVDSVRGPGATTQLGDVLLPLSGNESAEGG